MKPLKPLHIRRRNAAYGLAHQRRAGVRFPVVHITCSTCGFETAADRDAVCRILRARGIFFAAYRDAACAFALSGISAAEVREILS